MIPQCIADLGSVPVGIRPQRCFGQHFVGDLDLYFSVDRVYESFIGHVIIIP
jgi:hypothetical protein